MRGGEERGEKVEERWEEGEEKRGEGESWVKGERDINHLCEVL